MKKLLPFIALLGVLMLSGCEFTSEQQRIEYIEGKYGTKEIWFEQNSPYYVVRLRDGSIVLVQRSQEGKVEDLTCRQIFTPLR